MRCAGTSPRPARRPPATAGRPGPPALRRPVAAAIGVLVAAVLAVTAGCGGSGSADRTPASAPGSTAGPVVAAGQLDRLLATLVTAVDRRDRASFDQLVSGRDPGFPDTAGMIFDNVDRLHPAEFGLRATGRTRELAPRRRDLLGAGSYAAQVRVTWAVPGDRRPSSQAVWMTISPDRSGPGGLLWSGTADRPDRPAPTPLWWLEAVRTAGNDTATVVTGSRIDPAPWLARATAAAAAVAGLLHPGRAGPAADWNGRLVVIAPSNERLLETMLGVDRGAESALAAISWPDGDPVGSAPVRVMINPASAPSDLADRIVLTHEAVHVATASPVSAVPRWLIEGFADQIAYQRYPQARRAAAAALLRRVGRSGPPTRLPSDAAFDGSGAALDRSYTEAWLACRYLASRYGERRLLRFYSLVAKAPGGAIVSALHTAYGLDPHAFVTGWQDYLRRAAGRGGI